MSVPAAPYDMLMWHLLDPSLRGANHLESIKPLEGNAPGNHSFSLLGPNWYAHVKGDSGYPWDINLFDNNLIYLSTTELSYSSATQGKRFQYGNPSIYTGVPFAKRFWTPGENLDSVDSHFNIYTACGTFTTTQLGDVRCQLDGPFTRDDSGTPNANLPYPLTCIRTKYRWGGSGHTTGIYLTQEEYTWGYDPVGNKFYGLVHYQASNWNSGTGMYDSPFNIVIFNQIVPGLKGSGSIVDPCNFRLECIWPAPPPPPPPQPVITSGSPPNAISGQGYNFQFTVSGGTPPYLWTIAQGALPPGMTLSSGGALTGIPNTPGVYLFDVKVTDAS